MNKEFKKRIIKFIYFNYQLVFFFIIKGSYFFFFFLFFFFEFNNL